MQGGNVYYVVSRTAFFKPEKKGGVSETRFLTILDLWELEKDQARRFAKYPTSTIKKLKAQGIEDAEIIEVAEATDALEPEPTRGNDLPPAVVIETPSLRLKVRPVLRNPEPEPTEEPVPQPTAVAVVNSAPQPALRQSILLQFGDSPSPTPTPNRQEPWRGFVHIGRASDGEARLANLKCRDAVSFTYYYPTGQSLGQIFVCWYGLKDGRVVPSLEAFGEAWMVMSYMPDVVHFLSKVDAMNLTPEDFCTALERQGFQNMTDEPSA